eukprot:COSAG05_NODE_843_length_7016_cov_3.956339_3_plen_324_part_00
MGSLAGIFNYIFILKPLNSYRYYCTATRTGILYIYNSIRLCYTVILTKELDAQGVPAKPIPLKYVFKVKWDPSGNYLKHKARLCLVGCPRYCIAGVHYNKSDVYACCPDASMIRLIMVVALLEGWGNTNFDIKSAYLQALAGEGASISMSHPKEFKEFNENGDELLSKLLQNLYGHPAAASAWQKTLYEWIKEQFNRDGNGWTAKMCHRDRGIIVLTSPPGKYATWTRPRGENQVMMIIHSDDVDLYSENEEDRPFIAQEFNERFGIVLGDASHMLGVLDVLCELSACFALLGMSTDAAYQNIHITPRIKSRSEWSAHSWTPL